LKVNTERINAVMFKKGEKLSKNGKARLGINEIEVRNNINA
jgi:hypothetical protein